jgi:hypothetical protein
MPKEIRSGLNSGNACNHSVHNVHLPALCLKEIIIKKEALTIK